MPGDRYPLADSSLPHQIVLLLRHGQIAVSCNCLLAAGAVLAVQRVLPARQALAIWQAHHDRVAGQGSVVVPMPGRAAAGDGNQNQPPWHGYHCTCRTCLP